MKPHLIGHFFKIGSVSEGDIIKNFPLLQLSWPTPDPHTPPVIRVVLLLTELRV